MKPASFRLFFTEIVAALFVLLFLYTAIMKLRDPGFFAGSMKHSPVLRPIAGFLAGFIPGVELLAVWLLILPATRLAGLILASGLMVLFTAYIACILLSAEPLPCSCGGVIQQLNWREHLLFNLFFLAAGLTSILLRKKNIAINRSSRIPGT
ncbi:MAG: hypothetical protein HZA79_01080 [Sphingobacteriales bacterium]|nr:hypothetical protein [Sphingobacteriales bacterium]